MSPALEHTRDGQPYFYGRRSNLVGFNPYVNLVDLIVERSGLSAPRVSAA